MFARKLTALVALSLVTAGPAVAQSAAPLSLANAPGVARAGGQLDEASDLHGGYTGIVVGAVVIGILVFVVLELGKDNQLPGSP